jgi:hypothetical protein
MLDGDLLDFVILSQTYHALPAQRQPPKETNFDLLNALVHNNLPHKVLDVLIVIQVQRDAFQVRDVFQAQVDSSLGKAPIWIVPHYLK